MFLHLYVSWIYLKERSGRSGAQPDARLGGWLDHTGFSSHCWDVGCWSSPPSVVPSPEPLITPLQNSQRQGGRLRLRRTPPVRPWPVFHFTVARVVCDSQFQLHPSCQLPFCSHRLVCWGNGGYLACRVLLVLYCFVLYLFCTSKTISAGLRNHFFRMCF